MKYLIPYITYVSSQYGNRELSPSDFRVAPHMRSDVYCVKHHGTTDVITSYCFIDPLYGRLFMCAHCAKKTMPCVNYVAPKDTLQVVLWLIRERYRSLRQSRLQADKAVREHYGIIARQCAKCIKTFLKGHGKWPRWHVLRR